MLSTMGGQRWSLRLLALVVAVLGLSGCASSGATSSTIRTAALDVSPYQPSNSVWYSAAALRAKKPFARWEQDRDRIELVTWPRSCDRVPVAIDFRPGARQVEVELGRAPMAAGDRQCSAGHVLTSSFVASRALRRDRASTLLLDRDRITLPRAPALVVAEAEHGVEAEGRSHPLRQIDRPLPQYSVPDGPWTLAAPTSASSRTIAIGWIGGTCQPNAAVVYVVETRTTVTIDTALAPPPVRPRPPGNEAQTCAGVGIGLTARVVLHEPLGSRTLLRHRLGHRPAGLDAF